MLGAREKKTGIKGKKKEEITWYSCVSAAAIGL